MYLIVRSRPIRTRIDHSQPMKSLLIIIAVLTHQFLYEDVMARFWSYRSVTKRDNSTHMKTK